VAHTRRSECAIKAGIAAPTYTWDAENRMVSVDGVAGQECQSTWTGCYVYNALGQRVEKQAGTTYHEFVYDPAGVETPFWLPIRFYWWVGLLLTTIRTRLIPV